MAVRLRVREWVWCVHSVKNADTKANTHCAAHLSEVTALPLSASNSLIITSAVYVPSPFLSMPHNLLLAKLSAHDEVTLSNLWDAVTKANA